MVVCQTLTASTLQAIVGRRRQSAVAGFGNGQDQLAFFDDAHADDLVALFELHRLDAARQSAHRTDVGLVKADRHTLLGCDDHFIVAGRHLDPCQLVALVQIQRDQAAFSRGVVGIERDPLDDALAGDHDQIFILLKGGYLDHGGDLFILFAVERQKVRDMDTLTLSGALRDLVAFQTEDAAC